MNCEIENIFNTYLNTLPTVDGEEEFLITKGTLPSVPTLLTTDKLCITKGIHEYGCLRIDLLSFIATKRTYRGFGLLIFSALFSDTPEIEIALTHHKSDIKKIKLKFEKPSLESISPGFHTKPFAFSYWPDSLKRHPWYNSGYHHTELPYMLLTNDENFVLTDEDRASRDVVEGFGNNFGCSLLAELFLNIGRPQETLDRIDLECDAGYTGVSPASTEAWIWISENDDYAREILDH